MNWWQPEIFLRKQGNLKMRMKLIKSMRDYFDSDGFVEVETPALQTMPCADMHIHGFKTEYFGPDMNKIKDYYLHTSPEFDMKKLLVAGLPKIYQICKVYRNGESTKLHSPEFALAEWYRSNTDYTAMMDDCVGLLRKIAADLDIKAYTYGKNTCNPALNFNIITVLEAFDKYAEFDLSECLSDRNYFAQKARDIGVRVVDGDGWDDIFHAVMAEKIEPNLGMGAPTILCDYPASMACLSKAKADDPRFAERFELYVCGIELANAFTELTDAKEQRMRFEEEMAAKQNIYGFSYPIDEDFLKALEFGMPEASGVALGVDRLVMLACGADNIEDVLWTGKPSV